MVADDTDNSLSVSGEGLGNLLDRTGYRQTRNTANDVLSVYRAFWNRIIRNPNAIFAFAPPQDW